MNESKRIVVIGDSLVYGRIDPEGNGWVNRFRLWFEAQDPTGNAVFNLGIGGDTTNIMLKRIKNECKFREPDLLLIEIGVNDCRHIDSINNALETDKETFKSNLNSILTIGQIFTDRVIFLSMIPVDESRTTPVGNLYHLLDDQKEYQNIMDDFCIQSNVLFIDLFNDWLNNHKYPQLLEDGLHPNSNGHQIIFQSVKQFLLDHKII